MSGRYVFAEIKQRLRERQGRVVDFAIGTQQHELPAELSAWIRNNAALAAKPAGEHSDFAAAASALLNTQYGLDIAPAQILPTPGGRVAMGAFITAALDPGDQVLVTEPGYPAFARLAEVHGMNVNRVPLDPARNFAPQLEALRATPLSSLRAVALNYPNNPTGAVITAQTLRDIRAMCGADTLLFNDAAYALLTFDQPPSSALSAWPDGEAVELHSISKLVPLGPLAVSFLAGSEALMHKLSLYSEYAWSPLSQLQLQATSWYLRHPQQLEDTRTWVAARIQQLRETLVTAGFKPHPTPAGIYCICPLPQSIAGRQLTTATQAAGLLLDEFDLAVVPFDTPSGGYLRFCTNYRPEDLPRLSAMDLELTEPHKSGAAT